MNTQFMLGSSASVLSWCPMVRHSISTRASGAHSQRKATVCIVEQFLLPNNRHLGCDDYLRRTGGFMEHPYLISSVQFNSVAQSCPTLCNSMNRSTPGLPVHRQLPEFTQTHVHQVGDAIQPSHPLSSPFPPAPNPSQHQSLFQ